MTWNARNAVAVASISALNGVAIASVSAINGVSKEVGGGSVTRDVAGDASGEDRTTLSTGNLTIAGTSNRYALACLMKDDGAQTFTSCSVGGEAMTAIAAQYTTGFQHARQYELVNPTSGGSKVFTGVPSAEAARFWVAGVVYNGVNQTTPKNSTATPTSGSVEDPDFEDVASITVTTVSGGKAVVILTVNNASISAITLTPGTGVTVVSQETLLFGTVAILERDNNGGSTVVSCTVTAVSGDTSWRMEGYGIQP